MIRLVIGAFLSAVVLMAWGFVFWGISPLGDAMVQKVPGEDAVVEALQKSIPESGTYFYPYPDREVMNGPDSSAKTAFMQKHKDGPLVQITYNKEGQDMLSPAVYGQGFGHFFVSSLILGVLLLLALPGLSSYPARVLFAFLVGAFAAVAIQLANPIWFHHPWRFALCLTAFDVVGWGLAALVLGLVIRPRKA